jgi:hypothetical protein
VSGIAYNFEYLKEIEGQVEWECKKTIILQDFMALKLVYWDKERQSIGEESWKTYDSHVEENSGDDIWQGLLESDGEQQLSPGPPLLKRPRKEACQMSRLLESLKLTA